uniref:Uncharacterized protein n=1 Tax=Rhizophora mucronata TaxID=61149 RepID=A0A2P2Q1C4_RHIMU
MSIIRLFATNHLRLGIF